MMDDKTFRELFEAGEFGLILADGGYNLTPEQMRLVKEKSKEQSADLLLKKQMELASKPGYSEWILTPLIQKIIEQSGNNRNKKTGNFKKTSFDPIAVGNFLTGTSKSTSGVAGKLVGHKKSIIGTPKSKKTTATRISTAEMHPAEKVSKSTEELSKIYNFLKNTREEKRKDLETMKSFEESKMLEEERQHNEIINVFNKALGKKKRKEKDLSSVKMNFDKVFKSKKGKTVDTDLDESDESFTKNLLFKLAPIAALGGLAVLGANAIAKTTDEEEIKPQPSDTATKVPTERVFSISDESVRKKIRSREGGQAPEDAYVRINKVVGDLSSSFVKPGNVDITTKKPYTKKLTEMTMGEVNDLQMRRSSYFNQSGAGSAVGAYGFMPGTLQQYAKARYGDNWRNVPFTKDVQDLLAQDLLEDIKKNIRKAGLPISEAMIYTMWFFGSNNPKLAFNIVYGSDKDVKIESLVDKKAINANPHLKDKTLEWYRNNVLGNESKGGLSMIPIQGSVEGDKMYDKQMENTSIKDELKKKISGSVMLNRFIQPKVENNYRPQIAAPAENNPLLSITGGMPDFVLLRR